MSSRAVLEDLGMSGQELSRNLSQVAKHEIGRGKSAESLREEMVTAWRDYAKLIDDGSIDRPYGAANFFGQGVWRDRARWILKSNQASSPRRIRTVNGSGGDHAA